MLTVKRREQHTPRTIEGRAIVAAIALACKLIFIPAAVCGGDFRK